MLMVTHIYRILIKHLSGFYSQYAYIWLCGKEGRHICIYVDIYESLKKKTVIIIIIILNKNNINNNR